MVILSKKNVKINVDEIAADGKWFILVKRKTEYIRLRKSKIKIENSDGRIMLIIPRRYFDKKFSYLQKVYH